MRPLHQQRAQPAGWPGLGSAEQDKHTLEKLGLAGQKTVHMFDLFYRESKIFRLREANLLKP
jgi:hypothetical protein